MCYHSKQSWHLHVLLNILGHGISPSGYSKPVLLG